MDTQLLGPKRVYRSGFALALLLGLALTSLWYFTPLRQQLQPEVVLRASQKLGDSWYVLAGFFLLYVCGNFFLLPIPLITLAAAAVFPPWKAIPCGLLGSFAAASLGYIIGRYLDVAHWPRRLQRYVLELQERLHQREVWAILLLRLAPTPPFTVTSLVAGSCRIPFRAYACGTLLGIIPHIVLGNFFGIQLLEMLQRPQYAALLLLILAAGLYFLLQRGSSQSRRH